MTDYSAVTGTRRKMREMADGTLRVEVDIDPRFKKQFMTEFSNIDTRVAVALLKSEAQIQRESEDSGKMAQALVQSGFFLAPEVCRVLGSDDQFLKWIRRHKVSATKNPENPVNDPIEAAHVRRVANGAGTSIKPPYSAIPLLRSEHDLQTQKGESFVAPREQWEKWRNQYLVSWCKVRMYQIFGIESLKELDQTEFNRWAREHDLIRFVPAMWRQVA